MLTVLLSDSPARSRNTQTESLLLFPPCFCFCVLFVCVCVCVFKFPFPTLLGFPTQNENAKSSFMWRAWIFLPTLEVTASPR